MDGEEHHQGPDLALFFGEAVEHARVAICLTDATKPDNPIIYVNPAFEQLTGYPRAEAVGRNCRFLQGPGTDPAAVARLQEAVAARGSAQVEILNYRRDGSPFWNALHIAPIMGPDGTPTQYYGSQLDVSAEVSARENQAETGLVARELRHRAANLFSIFGALVSLSLPVDAGEGERDLADTLSARIHAMARAQDLVASSSAEGADLARLAADVLAPFEAAERLTVDGPTVALAERVAGPLGLVLHELATNAAKHGALRCGAEGALALDWSAGEALVLRWRESGALAAPLRGARAKGTGTGTQIIDGILASLGGRIDRQWRADGLTATISMPLS